MLGTIAASLAVVGLAGFCWAGSSKGLKLEDLPPAVQATVRANLNGAEIRTIGKEKEDGIVQYEVETVLNGKSRDFNVDSKGTLLVVEEGTSIDAIPAAARAGILKRVGDGTLRTVETFVRTGQPMLYEAAYTGKNGKKYEVLVGADGSETKE